MHVVLVEPEIPPNTGNVMRTCAATGTILHLVDPLGFALEDRYMRRAGLDYWPRVEICRHPNLEEFMTEAVSQRFFLLTTKACQPYTAVSYEPGDYLIFGRETQGLPAWLREQYPDRCLRIPMLPDNRSLNLSNSVAIVLFEALRQQGFLGMD